MQPSSSNKDKVKANTWRAYDYRLNGVVDNGVIASEPTFQFRSDGKMYFSQINPVYRDTLSYTFIDDNDVKLTRSSLPTYFATLKIVRLTDSDFDFDLSDNQKPSDVDSYKTTKQ